MEVQLNVCLAQPSEAFEQDNNNQSHEIFGADVLSSNFEKVQLSARVR